MGDIRNPLGGIGDMTKAEFDPNDLQGQSFGLQEISATIDLQVLGDTLIYTVPAGKTFYPTDFILQTVTYDNPSFSATASIGYTGPDYNEFKSNSFLSPSSTVGGLTSGAFGGYIGMWNSSVSASAGTQIYLKVTNADTGTALSARILVVGFLTS